MSRFKTELCNNLIELGSCKYGDRCHYAHGLHELRQVSKRHPKYRTESCKNFELTGKCPFGPRCSYVHPKPDLDSMIEQLSKYMKHTKAPKPEDSEDDSDDQCIFKSHKSSSPTSTSSLHNHTDDDHPHHNLKQLNEFETVHNYDSMNPFYANPNRKTNSCSTIDDDDKENVEIILHPEHYRSSKTSQNYNKVIPFQKISSNHDFHSTHLKSSSSSSSLTSSTLTNNIFNNAANHNHNFTSHATSHNLVSSQASFSTSLNRTPLSSTNGNSNILASVHDTQSNLHQHTTLINNQQTHQPNDQIIGSHIFFNSISQAPSTCSNTSLSSVTAAFEQATERNKKLRLIEDSSSSSTPTSLAAINNSSLTVNSNHNHTVAGNLFSIGNPLSDYINNTQINGRRPLNPNKQLYTRF